MSRFVMLTLMVILLAGGACWAADTQPKLIKVITDYTDTPLPVVAPAPSIPEYQPPSPREQMYVFWLAGRVISMPIDLLEKAVGKVRSSVSKARPPVPVQAAAVHSPFDNVNWREIPPAPPADDSVYTHSQSGR